MKDNKGNFLNVGNYMIKKKKSNKDIYPVDTIGRIDNICGVTMLIIQNNECKPKGTIVFSKVDMTAWELRK